MCWQKRVCVTFSRIDVIWDALTPIWCEHKHTHKSGRHSIALLLSLDQLCAAAYPITRIDHSIENCMEIWICKQMNLKNIEKVFWTSNAFFFAFTVGFARTFQSIRIGLDESSLQFISTDPYQVRKLFAAIVSDSAQNLSGSSLLSFGSISFRYYLEPFKRLVLIFSQKSTESRKKFKCLYMRNGPISKTCRPLER